MTGGAARNLKTPPPIHIKAKPENHTFSYIFSKREPHGFCICTYDSLRLYPGPNSCALFVCQLQFKPPYTPLLYSKTGEYRVTHDHPYFSPKAQTGVPARTASLVRFKRVRETGVSWSKANFS